MRIWKLLGIGLKLTLIILTVKKVAILVGGAITELLIECFRDLCDGGYWSEFWKSPKSRI